MDGGREDAEREVEGVVKETLPTLQFCLEQDLLTCFYKKEKQKSHTHQKKTVCCVERFKLTEEKERAVRTGIHVFGHIFCLGKLTPERARSDECAGNPIALSVPNDSQGIYLPSQSTMQREQWGTRGRERQEHLVMGFFSLLCRIGSMRESKPSVRHEPAT
jgi:hypothetical protein